MRRATRVATARCAEALRLRVRAALAPASFILPEWSGMPFVCCQWACKSLMASTGYRPASNMP